MHKKNIWRGIAGCVVLFIGVGVWMSAYGDFRDDLDQVGINVSQLEQKKGISRYEMVQVLAAGDCLDCLHPSPAMVSHYTQQWLDAFVREPANNFLDLSVTWWYYYCVAYAGDQWWVNWYPKTTSPFCPWKYCGANTVSQGELIQVLFNMIAKDVYATYEVNWSAIDAWKDSLSFDLDVATMSIIKNARESCNDSMCPVRSVEELSVYMRYCTYHTKECGMRTFPNLWEVYPVAQLNVLLDAWIVRAWEFANKSSFEEVRWEELLRYVERVRDLHGCAFEADYDRDGIANKNDSCPIWYNPNQKDLDGDGIWDVCDSDIDNDGILNPVGIVDDQSNIVVKLLTNDTDNCLFIPNTQQANRDKDKMWDECDEWASDAKAYLAIDAGTIVVSTAPMTTTFDAVTSGGIQQVDWEFGDWYFGQWKTVSHTFQTPWSYTVVAQTATSQWVVLVAKQPVTVGNSVETARAVSLRATPLSAPVWFAFVFTLVPTWIPTAEIRQMDWTFGDAVTKQITNPLLSDFKQSHTYNRPGSYCVQVIVYTTKNETYVAEVTVYVFGDDICLWNAVLRCDFDKDKIPDICDDDVDGDGAKQFLGLITVENKDCSLWSNISPQRWEEYRAYLVAWWSWDNCAWTVNRDQKDDNLNATGNVCDVVTKQMIQSWEVVSTWWWGWWWGMIETWKNAWPWDTDQDGIPDTQDACPWIPENKNGLEDADGCPELILPTWPTGWGNGWWWVTAWPTAWPVTWGAAGWGSPTWGTPTWSPTWWTPGWWNWWGDNGVDGTPGGPTAGGNNGWLGNNDPWLTDPDSHIEAGPCNTCPCQTANFWSALWKWDRVRAVLYDEAKSILYRYSPPKIIELRVPDVMMGQ